MSRCDSIWRTVRERHAHHDYLEIRLQGSAPPDIEGRAVERSPEGGVTQEGAGNRLESPVLQGLDQRDLRPLDDHPFLVEHEDVDADPRAAHRHAKAPGRTRDRIGPGGDQDIPGLEHRGQGGWIDVVRIYQDLARGKRQEARVDVHGRAAPALDLVDPVAVPQVPAQPGDARSVRHIAPDAEDVPSAPDEIRSVEDRLED